MSSTAVKKLIEARNKAFESATNEWVVFVPNNFAFSHIVSSLLAATSTDDDPVQLIMAAGRAYVPIDQMPESPGQISSTTERPSIDKAITDIMASVWYKDQIVHRRQVDAKDAQCGKYTKACYPHG